MGKLKSIGMEKRANIVSIGSLSIAPKKKFDYHRKEAVKSLKANNFKAYRFHSMQIAKINTGIVIGKARNKKGF